MKSKLLTAIVLLLVVSFLPGCGVAQEEYDAALAERDTAQAEVTSLQSDLGKVQSQIDTLESEFSKVQGQNKTLQSDLDKAEASSTTLKQDIDGLKARVSLLESRIPTLVYKTHVDEAKGFSINYPENWEKQEMEDFLMFFAAPGRPVNLGVVQEELPQLTSVQAYFRAADDGLKADGFFCVWFRPIEVSGMSAMRGIYLKEDVQQMYVALVRGKMAWVMVFTARRADFIDYAHTFNEIASSFELLK